MGILTFKAGDCGLGYFRSTLLICVMVGLSFIPTMVMLLTWITSGPVYSFAFWPMLYANMWFIPAWLLGTLCMVMGVLTVYAQNDNRRNMNLNVFVVLLVMYTVAIIGAGSYMIIFLTKDNDCMEGIVNFAFKTGGTAVRKSLQAAGWKDPSLAKELKDAGKRSWFFIEAGVMRLIYMYTPYPLSAFVFLHWQTGVSIMVFIVIPGMMALWSVYQALGTRNFFATNPPAYKNNKIADGPLWDDDSEYHESHSDVSFDSSSESPHDHESRKPLSKRPEYSYTSSPRNVPIANKNRAVVRVNPGSGKVVAGRNMVV